jgi:hypothetical protein
LLSLFHVYHPVSICSGQSLSAGCDRYTDLRCLCSVAIINTNVGYKVWDFGCVSPTWATFHRRLTNQHTHFLVSFCT